VCSLFVDLDQHAFHNSETLILSFLRDHLKQMQNWGKCKIWMLQHKENCGLRFAKTLEIHLKYICLNIKNVNIQGATIYFPEWL
jgi:hypothetical protein